MDDIETTEEEENEEEGEDSGFICTWCDTPLLIIKDPDNLCDYVCPRCKLEF